MKSTRHALFACAALVGLLSATTARATLVEALDLRQLVGEADCIVLGTVVDLEVHRDALDRIVTDASVRVDDCLLGRGARGEVIVVRRLGGELGDVGLRVEGEPSFAHGEQLVLFGREMASRDAIRPVGMAQGVMPVARIDGAEMVMPGGADLALVQRGSDGQLRPAPGALLEPEPLDRLLDRVRTLVSEIHGAR